MVLKKIECFSYRIRRRDRQRRYKQRQAQRQIAEAEREKDMLSQRGREKCHKNEGKIE